MGCERRWRFLVAFPIRRTRPIRRVACCTPVARLSRAGPASCNRCATPGHDRGRHDNPTTHPHASRLIAGAALSIGAAVGGFGSADATTTPDASSGRLTYAMWIGENPEIFVAAADGARQGAAHGGSEPRSLPGVHPRRHGDRLLQRSFRGVRGLDDEHRRNGPATDHPDGWTDALPEGLARRHRDRVLWRNDRRRAGRGKRRVVGEHRRNRTHPADHGSGKRCLRDLVARRRADRMGEPSVRNERDLGHERRRDEPPSAHRGRHAEGSAARLEPRRLADRLCRRRRHRRHELRRNGSAHDHHRSGRRLRAGLVARRHADRIRQHSRRSTAALRHQRRRHR